MVVAVEEVHVVAGVVVERPGVGAEVVLQPFHNKGAVERAEVLEELGCPSKNLQGVVALLRLVHPHVAEVVTVAAVLGRYATAQCAWTPVGCACP